MTAMPLNAIAYKTAKLTTAEKGEWQHSGKRFDPSSRGRGFESAATVGTGKAK